MTPAPHLTAPSVATALRSSSPPRRGRRGWTGRTLALVAAGGQVAAAFLPWDEAGASALVLGARSLGETGEQPTVALALIALAALAAIPALIDDHPLPRLIAGIGTVGLATVVVVWGAGDPASVGALTALAAGVVLVAAAALATGGVPISPGGGATRRGQGRRRAGFEHLDHTADAAFRAWGRTRAECFAAAVRGLVDSFVDPGGSAPTRTHAVRLDPATDEDLLVDLLGEVVYVLDVHRAVPVGGRLRDTDDGGLAGSLDLVGVDDVELVSAVPKAITYHDLEVVEEDGRWRCRVTIDV